jgi:hypothetical protein
MAPCRREHLNRAGIGALEHRGQIAEHAAGPFGQGPLNRPVQFLHDIAEQAGGLQYHHLTYDVCADPYRRAWHRRVCRLWELGQDVRR